MNVKIKSSQNNNPLKGTITFLQHIVPPLESGNYSVTLKQEVSSTDGKVDETFQSQKKFYVRGERFTLNPDDFSTCFPPKDGRGEYNNVLPHVVLTRADLPWQRSPGGESPEDAVPADVPSWLGLFLLDEDDHAGYGVPPFKPRQVTLLDLLGQDQHTEAGTAGKLPGNTFFPAFPLDKTGKYSELDYGESWDDHCMVIDVPVDLFNKIAPSLADLKWLAHVRQVKSTAQSETHLKKTGAAAQKEAPKMSVLVSSRLPRQGKKSTVHLVYLENWGPYLPGGSKRIPDGKTTVRLVSMLNWTFYAVSEQHTFAGLLLNLNKPGDHFTLATLQMPDQVNNGSDADNAAANALKMGYVPINHHTRQGDSTVSWYRGPFVPFDSQEDVPVTVNIPINSADAAVHYNPHTGMFDVSYAAAFQIGRMLALQNKHFATALYNWKRENTQKTISTYEQTIIEETLEQIHGGETEAAAGDRRTRVIGALKNTLNTFLKTHEKKGKTT
jgi:hypothetical protein